MSSAINIRGVPDIQFRLRLAWYLAIFFESRLNDCWLINDNDNESEFA